MKSFRTLSVAALFALSGAGLTGCISAPDFPVVPAIDFKEVRVFHLPRSNGNSAIDTLTFVLDFRDGDGDLGLDLEDLKVAPYNTSKGGPNDRGYGLNYFIKPYMNIGGVFKEFVVPGSFAGEYDGRYPRLDATDAKPAPLKGELRYKIPIPIDGAVYKPGQEMRFEIFIVDRALNRSNTVTTSVVKLGQ